MSSYNHTHTIYKEKRKPKNPIKFKIKLNQEQKIAKDLILRNTISLIAGKAGSGKTLLACQIALDGLFTKRYNKITITRPTVSKEEIGFLKGGLEEKMDPWVQPIYQNMYTLYNRNKIESCISDDLIEIVPLSFMRGRTFVDEIIIVDEAQNVTMEQMEMIVTRVGLGSKMIICGDDRQVDLKNKKDSGFRFLYSMINDVEDLNGITLQKNHRHPIVDRLLEIYEKNK